MICQDMYFQTISSKYGMTSTVPQIFFISKYSSNTLETGKIKSSVLKFPENLMTFPVMVKKEQKRMTSEQLGCYMYTRGCSL